MALSRPAPEEVALAFQTGLLTIIGGLQTLLDDADRSAASPIIDEVEEAVEEIVKKPFRFLNGPPQLPSLSDLGLSGESALASYTQQQVFLLRLSDLTLTGKTPTAAAANLVGWRLFAGNQLGGTVVGRVIQPKTGALQGLWQLAALSYDAPGATGATALVRNGLQASLNVDNLPAVQEAVKNADYELRVLEVPALHQRVFWLAATSPGMGDLVVPFPAAPGQPNPGLIPPGTTTTMDHFLAILVPLAKQRILHPPSHVS
jgi:hypothetical protein